MSWDTIVTFVLYFVGGFAGYYIGHQTTESFCHVICCENSSHTSSPMPV